jgi:AbrB family looped-hinge helix DNA binding protein
MSKITSKLQVTVPKAVAVAFGLHPGSEVTFVPAGEAIRLVPPGVRPAGDTPERRQALFDQATARQRARERTRRRATVAAGRGWRREDLYDRGLAR